ncbi:AraC family transcriptional regulator [Paenibacillus hamazuiensis]|uniref:AraC family transcriptional regulator n=1 Tax=Paenibacillus hamazuiensis TaxID=2936508 RepID=UPI00201050B8|nr:AraC family transcriptional regulator [Paenibacillus hamazuiensis]
MPFPQSDNVLQKRQVHLQYRLLTSANYPGFYHYHRGIEILVVYRGKGQLLLNRKMYELKDGCVVFLQPFQLHRIDFDVSEQCPYERTVLTFEPTAFAPFFKTFPGMGRFFEEMWKGELVEQVFYMENEMPYISAVLDRYGRKLAERHDADDLEDAAIAIMQILDCLQPLKKDAPFRGTARAESHAEKIMHWVEEHYTEPFDLGELAKELHLSRHHVSHLFRSETGSSITDYLIARRIRQACWLLKTETTPVEHIGPKVGIPNYSYFCRLFKKITGLTPTQYRSSY